MKRYYFVSDDLDDLAQIETELQQRNVSPLQMHLVSNSEAAAERRGLHQVGSLFKRDIVFSMLTGLAVGLCISLAAVSIGYLMGLEGTRSWSILGIISLLVIGFCTWEGGLFGIQVMNRDFRKFSKVMKSGKHLFYVDLEEEQHKIVEDIASNHSHLESAGQGKGEWQWLFSLRNAAYKSAH